MWNASLSLLYAYHEERPGASPIEAPPNTRARCAQDIERMRYIRGAPLKDEVCLTQTRIEPSHTKLDLVKPHRGWCTASLGAGVTVAPILSQSVARIGRDRCSGNCKRREKAARNARPPPGRHESAPAYLAQNPDICAHALRSPTTPVVVWMAPLRSGFRSVKICFCRKLDCPFRRVRRVVCHSNRDQ